MKYQDTKNIGDEKVSFHSNKNIRKLSDISIYEKEKKQKVKKQKINKALFFRIDFSKHYKFFAYFLFILGLVYFFFLVPYSFLEIKKNLVVKELTQSDYSTTTLENIKELKQGYQYFQFTLSFLGNYELLANRFVCLNNLIDFTSTQIDYQKGMDLNKNFKYFFQKQNYQTINALQALVTFNKYNTINNKIIIAMHEMEHQTSPCFHISKDISKMLLNEEKKFQTSINQNIFLTTNLKGAKKYDFIFYKPKEFNKVTGFTTVTYKDGIFKGIKENALLTVPNNIATIQDLLNFYQNSDKANGYIILPDEKTDNTSTSIDQKNYYILSFLQTVFTFDKNLVQLKSLEQSLDENKTNIILNGTAYKKYDIISFLSEN